MHQIQIPEPVYKEAQRRAAQAGYPSVDDYVTEMLTQDLLDDGDFDRLFTAERLAHIDNAAAEIERGDFFTAEQAKEELAKRRLEWIRKNAR